MISQELGGTTEILSERFRRRTVWVNMGGKLGWLLIKLSIFSKVLGAKMVLSIVDFRKCFGIKKVLMLIMHSKSKKWDLISMRHQKNFDLLALPISAKPNQPNLIKKIISTLKFSSLLIKLFIIWKINRRIKKKPFCHWSLLWIAWIHLIRLKEFSNI